MNKIGFPGIIFSFDFLQKNIRNPVFIDYIIAINKETDRNDFNYDNDEDPVIAFFLKLSKNLNDTIVENMKHIGGEINIPCYEKLIKFLGIEKDNVAEGIIINNLPNINGTILGFIITLIYNNNCNISDSIKLKLAGIF